MAKSEELTDEIQERDFQFAEQVVTRLDWMDDEGRAEFFAYLEDNYCFNCGYDRVDGDGNCGCT